MALVRDSECGTSRMRVDELPDECLAAILGHLTCVEDRNAAAHTCRRWLAIEGSTRKSVTVDGLLLMASAYDTVLLSIFSRFPALVSLSFRNSSQLSDSALFLLQIHCPHLCRLSLDCCLKITDDGLKHVGNGCHQLQFLSLGSCAVSDRGCNYIARGCPQLETLDLSSCSAVSDRGCNYIAKGCPRLQTLNLSSCLGITDDGISSLSLGCRFLKDVTISYCQNIVGKGFSLCSSLERLEAKSCDVTDCGVGEISGKCSSLRYLNLAHPRSCTRLSSFGLSNIGTFCKNLQVLNLRRCRVLDSFAVVKIATGCAILEDLNLEGCNGVTFEGWEAIALNCKYLQTLHADGCRNFCDRSMLALTTGCPDLCSLYLLACPNLSRTSVKLFKQIRNQVKILDYVEFVLT